MTLRNQRRVYATIIVLEWLLFGAAGVLFMYHCATLEPAKAIADFLGAVLVFVLNMLTWPKDKAALQAFDARLADDAVVEAPDDEDAGEPEYLSYEVIPESQCEIEESTSEKKRYGFTGTVTPEMREAAASLCRAMASGDEIFFGVVCRKRDIPVYYNDGPAQLARAALWSEEDNFGAGRPELREQWWATAAMKLETGWTP
jgi:hypothetical protein